MRGLLHLFALALAVGYAADPVACEPKRRPQHKPSENFVFDNSGLKIHSGGWTSRTHASDSYVEFARIAGGALGPFDYYYQLKLVPQISLSFKGCNSLTAPQVLERIAGKTRNSLLVVKLGIGYQFTADSKASLFRDRDVPILMVGNNNDNVRPRNGCFFSITNETVFPLFRYGGATDYESFQIAVTVERGTSVQYNIVKRIKETFSLFNAAYSWTDLSGARTTAFAAAAQQFEDAVNGAGEQLQRYNQELPLSPHGASPDRFVFTAPEFISISAGTLVLYPRLIASILVDTKAAHSGTSLSPETILGSRALSTRRCSSQILSTGTCDLKVETVHQSLLTRLAPTSPAIFDLNTDPGLAKVYDTCLRLRNYVTDEIELSTMDALAVRWSVMAASGLDRILADDKLAEPIAMATKIARPKLQEACWAPADETRFKAFVSAMNRKLP